MLTYSYKLPDYAILERFEHLHPKELQWGINLKVNNFIEPESKYVYALYDGQVAGELILGWENSDEMEVDSISVLPEFQGKGIAKALLQEAINFAKRNDFFYLRAAARQPVSRAVFLSMGFKQTGLHENWAGCGEDYAAVELRLQPVKIIGVMGIKRSGKDTIAEYLINNHYYTRYAFADPLKDAVQEMFLFTHAQMHGSQTDKETVDPRWGITPRRVLEIVGTDLMQFDFHRHTKEGEFPYGRKIWVRRFQLWYEEELSKYPDTGVVFSDVRFPHEVEEIRALGGKVWKVIRPSLVNTGTHASETELETVEPDIEIINDGSLEDLFRKVEENLAVRINSSKFA